MSGDSVFDRDTAVSAAGPGRWRASVDPRWNIAGAPNGGYLISIALSAIAGTVPQPDPLAVSAHFPMRTEAADAEVAVELVRAGRAHSTAAARLIQSAQTRVHVVATFGDLDSGKGPTLVRDAPPAFSSPNDCVPARGVVAPDFIRQFDLRLTPDTAAWATGKPSGVAEMCGWIRFIDGREPDSRSMAIFADSFPPTVFNVGPAAWVPTLELTVHVRGRPAPGWLQCRFQTRYLINGYLEEDGEIWDSRGQLVAQSRQLAQVRT